MERETEKTGLQGPHRDVQRISSYEEITKPQRHMVMNRRKLSELLNWKYQIYCVVMRVHQAGREHCYVTHPWLEEIPVWTSCSAQDWSSLSDSSFSFFLPQLLIHPFCFFTTLAFTCPLHSLFSWFFSLSCLSCSLLSSPTAGEGIWQPSPHFHFRPH